MSTWHRIASVAECPPGQAIERVVAGQIVALFNVDGVYYALDGLCPHQGGPLGQGRLQGSIVTCPWHGFQFDVRTGCHASIPRLTQPSLAVKVEGEEILVALAAPEC